MKSYNATSDWYIDDSDQYIEVVDWYNDEFVSYIEILDWYSDESYIAFWSNILLNWCDIRIAGFIYGSIGII